MAPSSRPGRRSAEAGFTLAGVIVIATIMMVVVAFTVPRMWSAVMQRERERQTIYAMKQYARAIYEFNLRNRTYPTSMQQITEARQPRLIRGVKGEFADPLTGQVDWLIIPQAAAGLGAGNAGGGIGFGTGSGQGNAGGGGTSTGTTGSTSSTGSNSGPATGTPAPLTVPGIPIKDYAGGPFIGVRPPVTGQSMIALNGQNSYETWSYTMLDYGREVNARRAAYQTVWK